MIVTVEFSNVDLAVCLAWHYYNVPEIREDGFSTACGGNLHVVLDDGNLEHGYIGRCIAEAIANDDLEGANLGIFLLALTEVQLESLYSRYEEYCYNAPRPVLYNKFQ